MRRLMNSFKRIWQSLRRITSSLTSRITRRTGFVAKAVGATIGMIMTLAVMVCLIVVIAIAAVPYGIFGESRTPTHDAVQSVVDIEFPFCEQCGITNVVMIKQDNKTLCSDCYQKEHPRVAKNQGPNPEDLS